MPSAMSRPSEPVETVSTSIDLSFLPSRMIEPLPKCALDLGERGVEGLRLVHGGTFDDTQSGAWAIVRSL